MGHMTSCIIINIGVVYLECQIDENFWRSGLSSWYWAAFLNIKGNIYKSKAKLHQVWQLVKNVIVILLTQKGVALLTYSWATADRLWPFMASSQNICFKYKQQQIYFVPVSQSATLSHTHTSDNTEVKTTFQNQLSQFIQLEKRDLMFRLPTLNYIIDQDAKWSNDMHDYDWAKDFRSILPECFLWKIFQSSSGFQRPGYFPSDFTLTKNRTSNKYTSLVFLWPRGKITHFCCQMLKIFEFKKAELKVCVQNTLSWFKLYLLSF